MDFTLVGVTAKSKKSSENAFKQGDSKPKSKRKSVKNSAVKKPEPESVKVDGDMPAPAKKKRRRRNKTAKKPVLIES